MFWQLSSRKELSYHKITAGDQLHGTHTIASPRALLPISGPDLFLSDPKANMSFATAQTEVIWGPCFAGQHVALPSRPSQQGWTLTDAWAGKQPQGNCTLPVGVQQHFAQLGALSLQLISKWQKYLVEHMQHPRWLPVFSNSARDQPNGEGEPQYFMPLLLCNHKTIRVAQWYGKEKAEHEQERWAGDTLLPLTAERSRRHRNRQTPFLGQLKIVRGAGQALVDLTLPLMLPVAQEHWPNPRSETLS